MKGASSAKAKLGYLENKAFDEMDEILYGYGFSYVHLRVTPLVNIAKAVAVENLVLQGLELRRSCANLTMSGPQNFCASSHPPCARHTCQHITGLWSLHRQF